MLVPAALTAVVTSVVSYYFLPTRYRSESSIVIVPARVPAEYVRSTATGQVGDRLQSISRMIMNRTRLERIMTDFNLYDVERKTMPIECVIRQTIVRI